MKLIGPDFYNISDLLTEEELFIQKTAHDFVSNEFKPIINEHFEQNFKEYINSYRINHAKEMIQKGSNFSLEGIGYESGFNSRTSFYRAFKKFEGRTPSEYLKAKSRG